MNWLQKLLNAFTNSPSPPPPPPTKPRQKVQDSSEGSSRPFAWTAFGTKKAYTNATRISNPVVAAFCRDLSLWLERAMVGTGQEALLLTITFPKAANAAESFRQCSAMTSRLISLQRSGLMDFMALATELHRVETVGQGGPKAQKASFDPGAEAQNHSGPRSRGPRPLGTPEEVPSSLLGHGHLHGLLLLPPAAAENLELQLSIAAAEADLHLDFVGGGSISILRGHRFSKHLERTLRYVLKEYRLEATENLSAHLPPPLKDLPASKYYLGANPNLYKREPFAWDERVALLQGAILNLCPLSVPQNFGSLRQATISNSLKQLVILYQELTGNCFSLSAHPNRGAWPILLIRRQPRHRRGHKILENSYSGIYLRMVGFFGEEDGYGAQVDLLLQHRKALETLFRAAAHREKLGERHLPRFDSQSLYLGGGHVLTWSTPPPAGQKHKPHLRLLAADDPANGHDPASPESLSETLHSFGIDETWSRLTQRVSEGLSLAQLTRIFYGSGGSPNADAHEMVRFLVAIGKGIRGVRSTPLGLFLWGPPGSGKTPLLFLVLRYALGADQVGVADLTNRFGLHSCIDTQAIIIEELRPMRANSYSLQRFKMVISSGTSLVEGKQLDAKQVSFDGRFFGFNANQEPSTLFANSEDWAAASKRLRDVLHLCNASYDPQQNPLGFDMDAFAAQELGETVFWALMASDRSEEVQQWAAQGLDWQAKLLEAFEEDGQVSQELLRTLRALKEEPSEPSSWEGIGSQAEWRRQAYPSKKPLAIHHL